MPGIDAELVACATCGERVTRRLTHRNSGGAFICRPCLAEARGQGGAVELYERMRIYADRVSVKLPWLLVAGVGSLAIAVLIVLIAA